MINLTLSHYSSVPLKLKDLRNVPPDEPFRGGLGKPNGLWVSVDGDDDWAAWCRSESFGLARYTLRHAVTLTSNHNVLKLDTKFMVECFDAKFGGPLYPGASRLGGIDWPQVMRHYDGVIIAPYQWSLRLSDMTWYYGWDCASGCIWNAKDVVEAVSEPEPVCWTDQRDVVSYSDE